MFKATTPTALALIAALALPAAAQPPADKKDDKKDPVEKFEPRGAPGAGQKYLARMAGEWDVKKSFFPRTPDAKPISTAGTCTQEMVLGGRFLRSEFAFDGTPEKTTGTGVIGFEAATGLFTSTWMDSRQTRMSIRHGAEKFDGTQIVMYGVPLDGPADGRKSKTVTTVAAGDGTITHKQYAVAKDGGETLVMELAMTRKKK